MTAKTYLFLTGAALAALLGLFYAGVSTVDFITHLDRQIHPVSCSLLPGEAPDSLLDPAQEGCKVAMMSPYSSFAREHYWGGIPWSLPALGVYGFGFILALWGIVSRRAHYPGTGAFLFATGAVAGVSSGVFAYLALTELETLCKTCMGSYIASGGLLLFGALALWSTLGDRKRAFAAPPDAEPAPYQRPTELELDGSEAREAEPAPATTVPDAPPKPAPTRKPSLAATLGAYAVLTLEMGLAVAVPVGVYLASLPDYASYVQSCGTLAKPDAETPLLLDLRRGEGTPSVLVFDPLCPACKAFHKRLDTNPSAAKMPMRIALMPLDAECNWMLSDSMHPGACLLSRALICAGNELPAVLDFVYEQQDELRMLGIGKDVPAIRTRLLAKFPALASCVDSPEAEKTLNRMLHWSVDNSLPIITPQLYVKNQRLCDEDTDLGLEYALGLLAK